MAIAQNKSSSLSYELIISFNMIVLHISELLFFKAGGTTSTQHVEFSLNGRFTNGRTTFKSLGQHKKVYDESIRSVT